MKDKFNLSLEENLFLAKKLLVQNVYSNAKIEGCNVTFPQTQTILEGVNVAEVKLDEIQCILNLRDAWKYCLDHIQDPFDLSFICNINSLVARNSLQWGTLRTGKIMISGTDYIPEIPEEKQVKKELDRVNEIGSITERAITYLLYGMRSQLFWDGNKRTSLICANSILIKNGKGILTIKDEHLEEFNQLLTKFYTTNQDKQIKQFLYDHCIYGIEK